MMEQPLPNRNVIQENDTMTLIGQAHGLRSELSVAVDDHDIRVVVETYNFIAQISFLCFANDPSWTYSCSGLEQSTHETLRTLR